MRTTLSNTLLFLLEKFENFNLLRAKDSHIFSTKNNTCKVPKFSEARKLCCNLPKTQEKRPNLWVFHQKDANGIANSEDPDQTAPGRQV